MADIFSAVQVGDEVVCRDCLKMEDLGAEGYNGFIFR